MGVDLYATNPDTEIPENDEWDHPMMSWRLWAAFVDLLDKLGADLSGLSHANDGEISAEQAVDWAVRIRAVAPTARRYVQGRQSWFAIPSNEGDSETEAAIGLSVELRSLLWDIAESAAPRTGEPELEEEDPASTERWLTFVAEYLKHSGGCLER